MKGSSLTGGFHFDRLPSCQPAAGEEYHVGENCQIVGILQSISGLPALRSAVLILEKGFVPRNALADSGEG